MDRKKVVVALGRKALGTTLPEQMVAVKGAAKAVADLVEEGCQVVISHSNAPQVGMIHTALNEFGKVHQDYTFAPMSVCSAMSQGYIGYDLQNAIREELLSRGISKTVSTIITQVVVDPYDEAFAEPIKVIGRYMSEEEAQAEEEKGNFIVKEEGRGYRRVVAAPKPVDIVEIDAIRVLSDADQVVIACGGGGIPVLKQRGHLKGASAVIEKDYASGKLAELLDADMLMILTNQDKICINYGTDHAKELDMVSPEEVETYAAAGQFPRASILPKMAAGANFVTGREGRVAVIAELTRAKEALYEKAGTVIK
jgi:carbamate kinase